MGNAEKAATLGMPHGTASNRLRKMLLFRQLKKHNENICVRCEKEIQEVDELSIEHIRPWEGISAELFWDLGNVAFSHIECNRPHRYSKGPLPMERPEGTNWCRIHKQFLPVEQFSKDASKWNGLRYVCKQHQHYYRD